MNESASKSSLASSSGKPSTANSSGSPSGRKTRTIIVARSISDEPAKVVPASRGEGLNNAVVNQHHSRDARSGKLASYAALGGAEDVERFDQFLAEQRGHTSASELRAAAASPHHMMASMKRKTMSRIQLEGIVGKLSSADSTGEDAAARKLMQQELENDARKRREEAIAQRKWLNSLPIHERVAQQRQQNALRKWRQMNRDWESFKARAARRLGKAPQELVMSRAAAFREQREMYDALQKAKPLSEKVGGDIWLVSLRNEGTRFVPVGNIFSGLFCPIRESTNLGPRVRRPLDYHDNQQDREHESSRPLSKLEKRSLNLLARKKWRLRKQLEILQPHEVEKSASSHLAVGTIDLFAWASGVAGEINGDLDDGGSVRTYSASVEDEVSRRRRLRSYASPSSPISVKKSESGNQITGPCLRIAHVAEEGEEPGLTPGSDGIESHQSLDTPLRLSFYTPVGEQEQRTLSITNDGSTIIHYQWWRVPFQNENRELTIHLRGQRTRKEQQNIESSTTISVSKQGGSLLPGECQQFVFTFTSSQAGVFLEKWLLDADPLPRVCLGNTPVVEDRTSSADLPIEVCLTCVAENNFAAWRRRQMQLARVEERETHYFVANLVDEIIDGVRPPEAILFNELVPRADLIRFYEQNGATEFGDVYFSPKLIHDCYGLYERAQEILLSLHPPQNYNVQDEKRSALEVEETSVGSETVDKSVDTAFVEPLNQDRSSVGRGTEEDLNQEDANSSSLPAHLTQEWNWRLDTLRELCKMADEAQNAQIRRLSYQLNKIAEEVEEEEENDEEDEDADDAEDGESDDEEANTEKGEVNGSIAQRLSPREVRKNERLTRRKALEDEIRCLQPNLEESFDSMRFSAYTAPYSSIRLQERLHERIGSLCGETPIACEIAKVTNNDAGEIQLAKLIGVGKLLMRAIDDAIGSDQDHQSLFEQERRKIQDMWLDDKTSFQSINPWMAKARSTAQVSAEVTPMDNTDIPHPPKSLDSYDNSGVVLIQLDLDLASWFSLVKVEGKEPTVSGEEVPTKIELSWRFSQDLLQHASYVPPKVSRAAEALTNICNALSTSNPVIHTVVVVSELSRPPLTRQAYKLLRNAVKAEIKAKDPVATQLSGDTDETKPPEGEQDDEAEAATVKALLHRMSSEHSLRSVAQVLQRHIQRDVVFCSTLEEVHGQIEFSRKELLLNSSVSLGGIEIEAIAKESEDGPSLQGAEITPRILLLDHLDVAGIELITQAARRRELASKPVTPAPPEPQKPAVGVGKKASVAVSAKGKPGTPGTSTASVLVPPVESIPTPAFDFTTLDLAGKTLEEQGRLALQNQFSRMAKACILDTIPSQVFEDVFMFKMGSDNAHSSPHFACPTFAGPTLSQELARWARALQPRNNGNQSCALTAVVGGKGLEAKIRLIDGLLELVNEIYFVGEVAMSLYRVLHTKQREKSSLYHRYSTTIDKNEDDLEDNAEVAREEDGGIQEREPLEDEPNDSSNERGPGERLHLRKEHAKGVWNLLVPAVEKLQQKASRKCVRLLLPLDWMVGETPLEEQDLSAPVVADEEDDEEANDDEEEDAEEEEDTKKSRNRRASEIKSTRQKSLVEPDNPDVFVRIKQGAYEGERAHVILGYEFSRTAPSDGWQSFHDVTAQSLSRARVTEGKASLLTSLWSDVDGEGVDEEDDNGVAHKTPPARFEYEWTFRAFDVGPVAMKTLANILRGTESESQDSMGGTSSIHSRMLIVNGVCGAVEFHEYCEATNHLLEIIRDYDPSKVFIAGRSTAGWLRQLEIGQQLNRGHEQSDNKINSVESSSANGVPTTSMHVRKVVDDRTVRNARVLKLLLAAKPHPIIKNLATSEPK
ncbi:unnamed protein product [Phytophthora lilii]|uniref:phosphoglycerate kinase n=1 Tax=Phytophthora lilii TaxID=2077276 RepID=A0A9W7CNX6_9STRA|nr:unnamed protein product [Phytophthora lilii]